MKHFLKSLFSQLIFWLLLFTFERTLFLLWYWRSISREAISFIEVLSVYPHSFKVDLSTTAYILVVPLLIGSIQLFLKYKWLDKLNIIYTSIVIIVYTLISVGEIGLFEEWNTKLSYKALLYLKRPDEVMNSIQNSNFLILLFILIAQCALFIFLYKRFFYRFVKGAVQNSSVVFRLFLPSIVSVFLFLAIRGGISEIPITASNSYFSNHNILNIAAVNPGYNIIFSFLNHTNASELTPFMKMDALEARKLVEEMHHVPKDSTISITKNKRPNIVFVMLESWPADVIGPLGGDPGITPNFNKLAKDGFLFTNFYASGNRSQQGNASIFAGLPALPLTTLSDHPEKYAAVPSLVKDLNEQGYFTSFYFGGQLIYGNLKSFLVYNEFTLIVEGDGFDRDLPRGKLGVHDAFVFERYANDLQQMTQPFFSTVFTLSSHSPYDYPGDRPIDWIKVEQKFVNSVHYTDKALGDFFNEMTQSQLWENTLFLVFSDHSHLSYKGYPLNSFEYHQIPLLITGGALREEFRGAEMSRIFSNHDLPATILAQLSISADAYSWSKDMMNPYAPEFAFFELTDGFGWKRPEGELVRSLVHNWYYQKKGPEDLRPLFEKEGTAYTQHLLQEFLSY